MRRLFVAALSGLLASCLTATPYQPAGADRYGFQEQQIESNRVRISFGGNTLTDRTTVETYLLYRAAEVTLRSGKDYFIVATRNTERRTSIESLAGMGSSHLAFDYWYYSPRHGWSPWYDPFWQEPLSYREVTRYEAVAEIAMFEGSKPANDINAFDAREVQANLQGRIVHPPPAS